MAAGKARLLSTLPPASYEHIVSEKKGSVGVIRFNRFKALNFENDPEVGAIVIT